MDSLSVLGAEFKFHFKSFLEVDAILHKVYCADLSVKEIMSCPLTSSGRTFGSGLLFSHLIVNREGSSAA